MTFVHFTAIDGLVHARLEVQTAAICGTVINGPVTTNGLTCLACVSRCDHLLAAFEHGYVVAREMRGGGLVQGLPVITPTNITLPEPKKV